MTPEAAIYQFMSGFGIPAYAASSVPDKAPMPYVTYDLSVGDWDQGEVNMTVNLWYHTESEALPNSKGREIGRAIGMGGVCLPCDGGMLWLKRGVPWMQAVTPDGTDKTIKQRYINVDVEYLIEG